jgi:hypothetical protein
MGIGLQGDTVMSNVIQAVCLLGCDEIGLWLADELKRPGSWVVMDEWLNPYVPWVGSIRGHREAVEICLGGPPVHMLSPMLLLNVDEITARIEGVGSIRPITEVRFEERAEIWKKCVTPEEGFWVWDLVIRSVQTIPWIFDSIR